MNSSPKVALVLGAGGSLGFAHIGILRELEKNHIHIDMIVGCSMGAIIGGCYSLGATPDQMEKGAVILSRSALLDIKIPNRFGFIKGDRAEKVIRSFLANKNKDYNPTFADCKIKFACIATDIMAAKNVYLTAGDLIPSMRASFSIGGVFWPVRIGGKNLLDGGILCRVPVDLARKLGADIVIAVDCIGETQPIKAHEINRYFDTVNRIFFMMDYQVSKNEINRADYLISLNQNGVNPIDMKNVKKSIDYGEIAMKENIAQIKQIIKGYKKNK